MTPIELAALQFVKNTILGLFWGVTDEVSDFVAWGARNVVGCGIRESDRSIEVYLASPQLEGFEAYVEAAAAGYAIRFLVTGPFQFQIGLGTNIHLQGHGAGKIGLFLQSGA